MKILTIDFESFYSREFSLTKVTTEEYIRSPQFEVIGAAVQVDDGEPQWFSGDAEAMHQFLSQFDWANSLALAHNAPFDGAILNWVFGLRPKGWLDTLSMGRALHGTEVGGSLKVLAQHYGLGEKGTEVENALGLHRTDFSPEQLARYGEYCKNDVALTWDLFGQMSKGFPKIELRLIDLTVRMFTEPVLQLDKGMLDLHLELERMRKTEILSNFDKDTLMSNPKFADLLRDLNVVPPMKKSPTNGKQTYAFSKTDEAFKALLEHENANVQVLVAARLGTKSTIEETRTERFIGIASRGPMPVPLRYYAAHTGRWGGDDKINLQNLQRTSPLKKSIEAPDGYMMIDSDSSQIEARTLAWLAEQNDLVDAFDRGEDVYKIMASAIYGKDVLQITKDERFVGKTTILGCIGAGSMVLCGSGWKPIEQVTSEDKLWDGEEWVCHQGLVPKGEKETLSLLGLWLTPDHKVLCGTQWLEAQSVVADANTLCQALGTGAENLPLQAISPGKDGGYAHSLSNAIADYQSTPLTIKTLRTLKVQDAIFALKNRLQKLASYIGVTPRYCLTTNIGNAYSIGCPPRLVGATLQLTEHICTTGGAVYQYTSNGGRTEPRFFSMHKRLRGGMFQVLKWIGLMLTEIMSPTTSNLYPGAPTLKTNEKLQPLSRKLQTYDLAYAGPKNRYTVLTAQGPMIVHNCGYGMGAAKFQAQLKNFNVGIELDEAKRIIDTYRATYPKIVELWKSAASALKAILQNQQTTLGRGDVLKIEGSGGVLLPNGLYLRYPNLRKLQDDDGEIELVYDTKKGKAVIPTRIYGGKVIENVCQALARIVIGEQMLMVAKKYKVVMTVHDAIACIVATEQVETAKEYVEMCMRTRPDWGMELPLNCEAGYGSNYGAC